MRNWMIAITLAMFLWPIHMGMRHEKLGIALLYSVIQGFIFWFITRDNARHIPKGYQIAFSQMVTITITFIGYVIGTFLS